MENMAQNEAMPPAQVLMPKPNPEDEKVKEELQAIFLDILGSAQKLSYELATIDMKDNYTREELKELFGSAREIIFNVKRLHKFLEKFGKRK
jgi:hypothetical protein